MGERQLRTNLESGVVTLAIPHPMTATDVSDLTDWFALLTRTLARPHIESSESAPTAAGTSQSVATERQRCADIARTLGNDRIADAIEMGAEVEAVVAQRR